MNKETEVEKLKKQFEENRKKSFLRALIYSYPKMGKTYSLRTWPFKEDKKPAIHIDSFDPEGWTPLIDLIEDGYIVVDSSFENDNYQNPTVFANWTKEFVRRKKEKYFDQFELYVVDSFSEMFQAIYNHIIADGMRIERNDGRKQVRERFVLAEDHGKEFSYLDKIVTGTVRQILSLPCNVILFGHMIHKESQYDYKSGKHKGMIMGQNEMQLFELMGQLPIKVGRLMQEIWYLQSIVTGKGIQKVNFCTQQLPGKLAGSRLASVFDIPAKIEADFSKILEIIKD